MATTEKSNSVESNVWSEWFQADVYKRTQGKVVRQVTFWAILVAFAYLGWRLFVESAIDKQVAGWMKTSLGFSDDMALLGGELGRYGVLLVSIGIGAWIGFRAVNIARYADFLIAVEAEMNKVTWPSANELHRSSFVVIFMILSLTIIVYVFDFIWLSIFNFIGVVHHI